MPLRMLNDFILVKMDDPEPEVKTFLEIPDRNSLVKRSHFATIVSCGPKVNYSFKPGQKIMLERWFEQGREADVIIDEEEYRIIAEHYVQAVVE